MEHEIKMLKVRASLPKCACALDDGVDDHLCFCCVQEELTRLGAPNDKYDGKVTCKFGVLVRDPRVENLCKLTSRLCDSCERC
jgi:hypothetical protein